MTALPVVQGGMGVGISAHRLAGTVAACGAVGTISSVDLRRHHPDLMAETQRCQDKEKINAANLTALDREIRGARQIASGRGVLAVNVMRASRITPPIYASPARAAPTPWWSAPDCHSTCLTSPPTIRALR
ncbi:MAG: hypothetical protein U1F35_07810 [Steroidobacteraceae bacterium]